MPSSCVHVASRKAALSHLRVRLLAGQVRGGLLAHVPEIRIGPLGSAVRSLLRQRAH